MARSNDLQKPGEKAAQAGRYYCFPCAQLDIESTCEMEAGQMFVACSRCLERSVAEWDLTWRAVASRSTSSRSKGAAGRWPGSLGPDA